MAGEAGQACQIAAVQLAKAVAHRQGQEAATIHLPRMEGLHANHYLETRWIIQQAYP